MHLKEEQELQQEMALQSRSLQHAQQQLEVVRQNRQRADEDVEVRRRRAGTRRSRGSQCVTCPCARAKLPFVKLAVLPPADCLTSLSPKSPIWERKQITLVTTVKQANT